MLDWLAKEKIFPKFYWANRKNQEQIAAVGKKSGEGRKFGALFFDDRKDPLFQDFSEGFFLPQKELVRPWHPFGEKISLPIFTRKDLPSYIYWKELVLSALQQMEKVVLARKVSLTTEYSIDPFAILSHLASTKENTTLFFYQPTSDTAFLGATPELLYERNRGEIHTEAVAGTKRKGESFEEKERREFSYVKDDLIQKLSSLCKGLSISPLSTIQTHHIHHLYTSFTGTLHKLLPDPILIQTLHPTPATLGYPINKAKAFLKEKEPFARGLYAAPIGWISPNRAEVAVALRSCVVQKNTLHLFSGAGIVKGSHPEKEWEELESKLGPFLCSGQIALSTS